jgi:hypothetical protein
LSKTGVSTEIRNKNEILNTLNNQILMSYQDYTAKYKKEIANSLGLSLKTFQRRLKDHQILIPRGLISPAVQKEIYQKLGWPELSPSEPKRHKMT